MVLNNLVILFVSICSFIIGMTNISHQFSKTPRNWLFSWRYTYMHYFYLFVCSYAFDFALNFSMALFDILTKYSPIIPQHFIKQVISFNLTIPRAYNGLTVILNATTVKTWKPSTINSEYMLYQKFTRKKLTHIIFSAGSFIFHSILKILFQLLFSNRMGVYIETWTV